MSFSRYEVEEELGQGGMSTVYRGEDTTLGRTVAVKVLHEHLAKKAENRERFRREARAIASLSHPNILDVYDFSSEDDERSYIIMEYIPGQNLREFIDEHGPPPPELGALIGVEIAKALEHAHEHGIIHRDLKPENVMISVSGEVKLMDFGIAHVIDAETMTKTGSLLGSPAHMAPELIDSGKVDERADIFSLGTVLYLLTTGELPFCGSNAPQVLRAVMECRYDEPEFVNPRVGHRIGAIIERALHKDPEQRYQSVPALRRDLLAAVHEVGIDAPDSEIDAYFDDPGVHAEGFPERIIPALTQSGKRALDRKQVPEAMGFFNRVLAYEPDNEEVQDALAKLNRDQKLARAGRIAAVVLALAALGVGTWWLIPRPDPAQLSVAEASTNIEDGIERARFDANSSEARAEAMRVVEDSWERSSTEAAAAAVATVVRDRAETVSSETRPNRFAVVSSSSMPSPSAISAKAENADLESESDSDDEDKSAEQEGGETVNYKFLVKPSGAQFTINGKEYNSLTAAVNGIDLEAGEHYRVKAQADACRTFRKQFTARKPPPDDPIPIMLEYRDGAVAVTTNRPAVIFIDGKLAPKHKIRESGGSTRINVDFGKAPLDKQSKKVKIRVARADNFDVHREQTVEVSPGKLKELNVQLP